MTTQTTTGAARPAGRPRSEKAEKAIIEATLDLIGEGNSVSELSIEAIAARAGVGKTTIYRRWSNKEDLVVDALSSLKAPLPQFAGRSVREDLITWLRVISTESADRRGRCVMNILNSDPGRHPRVMERFYELAIKPRREAVLAVLRRGVANGELRPDLDVDLAMTILNGALVWAGKWLDHPGQMEGIPDRIVNEVLRGFAPA
ncbi:TetR/AcrR family transcriptional regulator [Streptosporangiaceae bacterium NEAU-GS5]|nr:TetR/AcrR family transcriptional regulator [Streptosporangiaceae bacterium NEAU-GS5]